MTTYTEIKTVPLLAAQGYFTREPEPESEIDENGSIGNTPPCEFDVEIDQGAPTVSNANDSEVLTPADLDDSAKPVYEGTVDGQAVELSVLMGTSQADLQDEVASSENQMDYLLDESLDEASDGDVETNVAETFAGGTVPADGLEPVAYTLETPTSVEYGSASSLVCVPQELSSAEDVTLPVRGGMIMMPNRVNLSAATVEEYPETTSVIRYRTFIPGERATTKKVCGTFKGDNRGFSTYFEKGNRTRVSMFFNWPDKTIDTTKNVGATHRLKEYGFSAKTKTASSKGIKFHSTMMSRTFGKISVTHSVGNPLCGAAGAIRYNLVMEAWKDGSARISGKRGKVPNHEAYVYPKSGAYGKKIFTRKSKKFICLSVNCGDESLWEVAN